MPYAVLMPVFAAKILHGNARTLGILMTAAGVGALIGALLLASRRGVTGLGKDRGDRVRVVRSCADPFFVFEDGGFCRRCC